MHKQQSEGKKGDSFWSCTFYEVWLFTETSASDGSEGERSCVAVVMKHEMQPQGQNNECGSETGETENTFINTFEERFQQFYLQLSDGKTGGMVVR